MSKAKTPKGVPVKGQRIAMVTGATSGIGEATAELFCKRGIAVIVCGRRVERLREFQKRMEGRAPVYPLMFDVTSSEAVFAAVKSLPEEWRNVNILINNAGNAHGLSPVQDGSIGDWDAMIDINLKGLLYVSRAVLPLMPKGPESNSIVVNVGSIAGKEAYPNGGVYCASKAAVDMLTRGMKLDLYKDGIKVAAMHPGLVNTEFSLVRFKGDQERAAKVYDGFRALTAYDCADAMYYMISRPSHVNVSDMMLMPTDQAAARDVHRAPSKL
eukprot:TRINITY_DN4721_c1_g1_i1.p2 TRINITY_DN4721_c1_g1~~TRINITY_DN4721_c1_g1_i1.p2  ORF type:complete len:270 (+),score=112.31 TRINITY_DN4721_c1_g1_i1:58-867(+)